MLKVIQTPLLREYGVVIIVNLLGICAGMDLGWSSPVLVKLRDPAESPLSRPVTKDEGGWIVSIGYLCSVFTLPCVGFLMDYIGRRNSIVVVSLSKIVAGAVTIFASEIWMLLVARAINAISSSATFIIITVYSTEISNKEIRGSLGLILTIFSNLGILVMLSVGPYISYLNLSITMTAVTVCATIPLLFVPDTPYSLYNKGKIEEAKKVLTFFRGSEALADEELKQLSQPKLNQNLDKREIFNKVYLKTLIIVMVLGIGTQFVGFNFVSFYLQTILEMSETRVSPALGSVVIGIIQLSSSIFTCIFIDKFGRRPMLVSTLLILALGMIGLGIFFVVKAHGVISGMLNYLPILSLALVTCSYSAGIGCLYFVLIGELLDGPIRAAGSAMSTVVSFLTLFLLTRYAMAILSAMGSDLTFFMFGASSVLMSLFVYFFVPETKQKTNAEIQRALKGLKEDEERF